VGFVANRIILMYKGADNRVVDFCRGDDDGIDVASSLVQEEASEHDSRSLLGHVVFQWQHNHCSLHSTRHNNNNNNNKKTRFHELGWSDTVSRAPFRHRHRTELITESRVTDQKKTLPDGAIILPYNWFGIDKDEVDAGGFYLVSINSCLVSIS
jgi:hypothetical protein